MSVSDQPKNRMKSINEIMRKKKKFLTNEYNEASEASICSTVIWVTIIILTVSRTETRVRLEALQVIWAFVF